MTFENIEVAHEDAIVIVTINRPKVLNALNGQTIDELHQVMTEVARSESVRCVVLTGAGDKAFVAGADIGELAELTPVNGSVHSQRGQALLELIESLGKPVIAAINGYALGGGCELAMACTIRLASDSAKLGQPEINLGIMPGYAGSQRLPRLVGKGRALELLLTGAHISADGARLIGLVNRVVPATELMTEAKALACELAGKAPIAVRAIIAAVNEGLEMPLSQAVAHESALFGLVASTEDMREGTRAFLEKRKPVFKGS
ncbi:MAG: crotonase [Acidobacteria bacterium]|nr:crotonase [Acidobacteriota bacterium]